MIYRLCILLLGLVLFLGVPDWAWAAPPDRQQSAIEKAHLEEMRMLNERLNADRTMFFAILLLFSGVATAGVGYANRVINRQKQQIQSITVQLSALRKKADELTAKERLTASDIYALYHSPTARPTHEDFARLVAAIDSEYDGFTSRLQAFYPAITYEELWICCMLKIRLPSKQICSISAYHPNTLSMARRRLFRKMTGREGSATDLDEFIVDF